MQRRLWPIWAYYAVAIFVFLMDQLTKKIVDAKIELYERIGILWDFFILTHIRNRGAAFGMLQEQRLFFLIITVTVVAGIIWYMQRSYRTGRSMLLLALGLILGGAVGNFLDRALYGEVVDFLQFNFGSYTFPIFNLADTGICVGVGLVVLDALLSWKQENNSNDNGDQSKSEPSNQEQQPV